MKGERRTAGMYDLLTPNEGVNGEMAVLLWRWRWKEWNSEDERGVEVKWGELLRWKRHDNSYKVINPME